jgi:nitric oxide reductase large subunit
MATLISIVLLFVIISLIAWKWIKAIDYMHKNHPDYKGEDLFDEDKKR